MNLREGTLLQGGKYRIKRFINSGGFGCTYVAEHMMLEKRVAIKEFFVKDFCNRDSSTALISVATQGKQALVDKLKCKFIEEAKALARMHHFGIVNVSDVFEENGTAYYVMDYIEGRSLHDILNREDRLSEERALGYIRQVAEALAYVHDQHRLHLDVKPGNIMVDSKGNAILIDFGTSKQYDEENGENTSTVQGYTKGFAPPEQMTNDMVKFMPSTDIYALGATLYKLLTGITPPSATLRISGEGLVALPASVSVTTEKAIEQAMQLNKAMRPQTVNAFLALLEIKEYSDEVTEFPITPDQNEGKWQYIMCKSQKEINYNPNLNVSHIQKNISKHLPGYRYRSSVLFKRRLYLWKSFFNAPWIDIYHNQKRGKTVVTVVWLPLQWALISTCGILLFGLFFARMSELFPEYEILFCVCGLVVCITTMISSFIYARKTYRKGKDILDVLDRELS